MGSGPFCYPFQTSDEFTKCAKRWYLNLLYINNLDPAKTGNKMACMGWTWYLDNDFQFFFYSVFALAFYFHSPKAKYYVCAFFGSMALMTITVTGVLSDKYNLNISTLDAKYGKYIYVDPYTRAGPYAVGVLFGIYWYEREKRKASKNNSDEDTKDSASSEPLKHPPPLECPDQSPLECNPRTKLIFWILCFTLCLLNLLLPLEQIKTGAITFFGQDGGSWSQSQRTCFNALQRTLYGVSLCGILHWLITKPTIISTFIRSKFWEPLAKLSYGIYLWHIIVIQVRVNSTTSYPSYSRWAVTVNFISLFMLATLFAYFSYILVEKPCMNLEGAFMKWLKIRFAHGHAIKKTTPMTHIGTADISLVQK